MDARKITMADIAEEVGVSKATVSRILNGVASVHPDYRKRVEEAVKRHNYRPNMLARSLRASPGTYGPTFAERMNKNQDSKAAIARRAAQFIEDGMTVFLDAGSTVLEAAYLLGSFRDLVVVTTSVAAVEILKRWDHQIVVAGGTYVPEVAATTGTLAGLAFSKYRADVALIGVSALSSKGELRCYSAERCRVKRAMIRNSVLRIVLADHTKVGTGGPRFRIPLQEVDYVVTDAPFNLERIDGVTRPKVLVAEI